MFIDLDACFATFSIFASITSFVIVAVTTAFAASTL